MRIYQMDDDAVLTKAGQQKLIDAAQQRIEALEAALRRIADVKGSAHGYEWDDGRDEMKAIAEAALEGRR